MKIKYKLTLIVATVAVVGSFVSGYVYYLVMKQAINERMQAQLESTSVLKENQLRHFIEEKIGTIESIIKEKLFLLTLKGDIEAHATNKSDTAWHKHLRGLLRERLGHKEDFTEFFVLDSDGKIHISTDVIQEGKIRSNQDYFINGKEKTYIQNFYYDLEYRKPTTMISVPISDEAKNWVGTLVGRLDLGKISEVMTERSGLGRTGETYLVNRFNLVMTELRKEKGAALKKVLHKEPIKQCIRGRNSFRRSTNYRNIPTLGYYRWLPSIQACLVAEIEQEEAFEPAHQFKRKLLFIAIILIFSSLVLGMTLTRTISESIVILRDATKRISNGKLNEKIEIKSKDEIGELAVSFNQMIDDLNKTTVSRDSLREEVAERKKAEIRLKELTRELSHSNRELEQFAYVASHDLQEPLRMVASYLQLLERRNKEKLDSDSKEFIGFAVDGATRMRQLINDLLAYSRVGTRGKPFAETKCEAVFAKVIKNLEISIVEYKAKVTHGDLPKVMADEGQLIQLFQNLISNALKFCKDRIPEVHVSAQQEGDHWIFGVRDNGIGIAPEHRERIFQIFQRLHSREEYEGTGIGLAVCKKIVERHGGKIWVESEVGVGTTFWFTLSSV